MAAAGGGYGDEGGSGNGGGAESSGRRARSDRGKAAGRRSLGFMPARGTETPSAAPRDQWKKEVASPVADRRAPREFLF
jgi:hypothetical protein